MSVVSFPSLNFVDAHLPKAQPILGSLASPKHKPTTCHQIKACIIVECCPQVSSIDWNAFSKLVQLPMISAWRILSFWARCVFRGLECTSHACRWCQDIQGSAKNQGWPYCQRPHSISLHSLSEKDIKRPISLSFWLDYTNQEHISQCTASFPPSWPKDNDTWHLDTSLHIVQDWNNAVVWQKRNNPKLWPDLLDDTPSKSSKLIKTSHNVTEIPSTSIQPRSTNR